jgi:mitochondrial fission protein ELM1
VLTEDRAGNTSQSLGLADALDWPWERKKIQPGRASVLHNRLLGASLRGVDRSRSDPLEPPWPDLVIAAGRRTAPVSLWLREQNDGSSRLVHLGRKGADHAALFDLAVTPTYTRLFPHPRRLEVSGPLHRITPERLAEARGLWKERLEPLPSPRIVLLVGGTSGQYHLDVATAQRLGRDVARMAREAGGSVLASTSRRTSALAVQAMRDELRDAPGCFHRAGDPDENPYLGFLAFADELVLTADSESMLMEAASLGKPMSICPLPERRSFRLLNFFREQTLRRATAQPAGPRGTGRPQRGLELLCARLIERGFVRPARDLRLLHEELVRRGVAQILGAPPAAPRARLAPEAPRVAARIRTMLGFPPDRP